VSVDVVSHQLPTVTPSGQHSVLLFLIDEFRRVTPEDKMLKGFEKVRRLNYHKFDTADSSLTSRVSTFTHLRLDYSFAEIQIEPEHDEGNSNPHFMVASRPELGMCHSL
jgi:hypothetical protein